MEFVLFRAQSCGILPIRTWVWQIFTSIYRRNEHLPCVLNWRMKCECESLSVEKTSRPGRKFRHTETKENIETRNKILIYLYCITKIFTFVIYIFLKLTSRFGSCFSLKFVVMKKMVCFISRSIFSDEFVLPKRN